VTQEEREAVERLSRWLDDFDRNNADDQTNDTFELGQDELIEVPAADLRTALSLISLLPGKADREAAWQTFDALPDVGRKFIALFNDGSGAAMFWRHDCGYIDADGNETETLGSSYDHWAYLPDDLDFWCEGHPEEPVILRLPPAPSEGEASYRCTRCGRNEIDAKANGCTRGPCPMELVR